MGNSLIAVGEVLGSLEEGVVDGTMVVVRVGALVSALVNATDGLSVGCNEGTPEGWLLKADEGS